MRTAQNTSKYCYKITFCGQIPDDNDRHTLTRLLVLAVRHKPVFPRAVNSTSALLASNSADPLVRESALFLLPRDHGRRWLGVDDTQYNSVHLEHQNFYLSTVNFSVGSDAMVRSHLVS
jgi:hypothetical protein